MRIQKFSGKQPEQQQPTPGMRPGMGGPWMRPGSGGPGSF